MHAVNQSGVAGEGAMLTCEVEGDQPLRVSWAAVHHALTPLHSRMVERASPAGRVLELHLDRLSRRDAGPYRCSASNDFGQDEMMLYLTVKEPPEAPDQVEVVEVGSRWLSVAWGRPYPSHVPVTRYVVQYRAEDDATWGNATVGGTAHSARIESLQPSTPYTVRLLAANDVGESVPSPITMAITLQEAPSGPPTDVYAEAKSSQSIHVRWKPPHAGYPREEVQGYQVVYREAAGGSHQTLDVKGRNQLQATLSSLRQFCRYEISVQATNMVGAGPTSPPLYVTTLDGVPDLPPQDVQCNAISSQSIRVRWDPPTPDHQNGIILGYKVIYRHTNPVNGIFHEAEVKKTTNLETNLHGLSKYTNYSVRVLAFTVAGEGVKSEPIYCTTEEDVPGPPEQIKALAMTSDSILVAWTRPVDPNGQIIKYYVYSQSIQEGNKDVQKDTVFGDSKLIYEARKLKEFQRYEFWVTAATVVGEGPGSAKVTQSPISRVPARIASFSRRVVAGAGGAVVLPCHAVGLPAPSRSWRGLGGAGRHTVLGDHGLALEQLRPQDAGNYTCLAENVFGRDEVTYSLVVQVPPGPPQLSVAGGGTRSLALVWRAPDTGGSPITGYTLKYRHDAGEWRKVNIDSEHKSYNLEDLKCGSTYHMTLAATNVVGTGKPSSVVTATTKGGAPKVPLQEEFLNMNSTSATLYLEVWPDGGCPIKYFEVKYRPQQQSEWVLVSGNAQKGELVIPDLFPATWYIVWVTAHNDAGSSEQEFLFATRTHTGEIFLMDMVADTSEQSSGIYPHLNVIIPVISGIICTIAVTVCVCIVVHRRYVGRVYL